MHSKAVMCDFEEGAIDFAPTYRMIKGKDAYSNKKYQNPSYTDRVLWRSLPGSSPQLYQTLYTSAPKLDMSDHRPVLASFAMNVREPFIARGPITADGGQSGPNLVITSITNLTFTVADETAHPRAKRAVKFDGYNGLAVVSFTSCIYDDVYCSAPAECADPDVAAAWRKGSNEKSAKPSSGMQLSSSSSSTTSTSVSNNPCWAWDNADVEDMFPLMSDCEWLATQSITAVVRKGARVDAPILGQCEIPLSGAFEILVSEEGDKVEDDDFDGDDEDLYGSDTFTSRTRKATGPQTPAGGPEEVDEKTAGSHFKVQVLKNGKYIGDLSGKICMTHVDGIDEDEDEAEIAEKLVILKRTVMGLREKRAERIAITMEAPAPAKMRLRGATLAGELQEEEKKVEAVEVADHAITQVGGSGGRGKKGDEAATEEDEDFVEEPTMIRIGGKVKSLIDDSANESDNEDDVEEGEDEDEDAGPDAWMEGDEVVCRTGQRWTADVFMCVITGQNLVEEDFILRNIDGVENKVEPFSKVVRLFGGW